MVVVTPAPGSCTVVHAASELLVQAFALLKRDVRGR